MCRVFVKIGFITAALLAALRERKFTKELEILLKTRVVDVLSHKNFLISAGPLYGFSSAFGFNISSPSAKSETFVLLTPLRKRVQKSVQLLCISR